MDNYKSRKEDYVTIKLYGFATVKHVTQEAVGQCEDVVTFTYMNHIIICNFLSYHLEDILTNMNTG